MGIRIRPQDKAIHSDLTKKAKAKIRRLEKKHGKENIAPYLTKISTPSIGTFSNRKQFNKWVHEHQRFINRSVQDYQFTKTEDGQVITKKQANKIKREENKYVVNSHGVKIKKSQEREMQRLIKKHQAKITKENNRLGKLPFIQGGKVQEGTVGDRMGLSREVSDVTGLSAPMDYNRDRFRSIEDVEERLEDLRRFADKDYLKKRRGKVKDNFIYTLGKSFNSDADLLIEKIQGIDPDDFYEMFLMFDEINFNDFDSDGHGKDNTATVRTLERIDNYIQRYEEIKKNNGALKDF